MPFQLITTQKRRTIQWASMCQALYQAFYRHSSSNWIWGVRESGRPRCDTQGQLLSPEQLQARYLTTLHLTLYASHSRVRFFATAWTVAHQVPLSLGFSRQEYWSGLPCALPGDLPDPGVKPRSPTLQVDSSPLSHQGSYISLAYL